MPIFKVILQKFIMRCLKNSESLSCSFLLVNINLLSSGVLHYYMNVVR